MPPSNRITFCKRIRDYTFYYLCVDSVTQADFYIRKLASDYTLHTLKCFRLDGILRGQVVYIPYLDTLVQAKRVLVTEFNRYMEEFERLVSHVS